MDSLALEVNSYLKESIMARDIPSIGGTVQLVLSVEVLERILDTFPHLDVFQMPSDPDDLPTYGFTPKQ